jgi:hypothetical protein
MFEDMILEGRNRYRACLKAGVEPRFGEFKGDDAAATAFVISKNIHRRHLTAKQKHDVIARLLKERPEASDRSIAKLAKVSDKTVGAVRRAKEARAEIPNVEKRTDTQGRKQPAKKAKQRGANPAEPEAADAIASGIDQMAAQARATELEATGEHDLDLAEQLQAAKIKIAGLESEIEELKTENADLRAKLEAAGALS